MKYDIDDKNKIYNNIHQHKMNVHSLMYDNIPLEIRQHINDITFDDIDTEIDITIKRIISNENN